MDQGTGTTERVLQLLAMLQRRPVWTGTELAERLGVTTRSIRRDVERLRALGYPVNATQGSGGGYQLGAGRALPPLLLDDEEAIATAVALRLAAGGTVAGASEAAVRTLAKLDQVLPARLRGEIRAIHDAIVTLDGGRVEVDADALLGLARACRDTVRVEFGYVALRGERTERRVEPYQLVATGRRWYLLAYDLERDDWRSFRLDRMSEVRAGTWRFTRRESPDPAEYVQRAVTVAAYPHQARVLVHAPAAEVRERTTVGSATVEEVDERTCLLLAGSASLYSLALHVGMLGWDFEVQEPPELREAVAELAGRFARAVP
ncbi:YafY family transcriptional regulator [Nocardioides sp. KIGAM211]|uniref:YafY family transcriptional regulator n=1 Tax=Nocardioides luti TaxID=2761101 RepID=A0A7X0RL61_9ACTN|nr:YafY family protein [Nocardioides luti]MBB6629240.1 YafY family transcriptional regulator [Nocardioides luti]